MVSRPDPPFQSLDPRTLLDLARRLATDPDPAAQRAAGDRAYYAAFLFSRNDLAEKDHVTPSYNSDDHSHVQSVLRRPNILGMFGDYENQLRRARNLMTYDTSAINKHSDLRSINWMIGKAAQIIEKVEQVPHRT